MKLYPPQIEGIIPSFSITKGKGGATIVVPFSMNKVVSTGEVSGFSLKVKTIIDTDSLFTIDNGYCNWENSEVSFALSAPQIAQLNIGQHYKVQIAYIATDGEVGYYSTVGVIKCTDRVACSIKGLSNNYSSKHSYNYVGCFEHDDASEKVYQYRFILRDEMGEIIDDSGEQLHYVKNDTDAYYSEDAYSFNYDLEEERNYSIQYIVTTNNKMKVKTPRYKIFQGVQPKIKEPLADLSLYIYENKDDGYISIDVRHIEGKPTDLYVTGSFLLTRSSSDSNFKKWDPVCTIYIKGQGPVYVTKNDYAVEQGRTYQYALQQYNNSQILSGKKYSNKVYMDFEDMFLLDKDMCLKVRFNPKVSSFKTNLLEAKQDTLGGKFPFFFKNGNSEYKEFPINGLISYKMDDGDIFIADKTTIGLNAEYNMMYRGDGDNTAVRLESLQNEKNYILDFLRENRSVLSVPETINHETRLKTIYTNIAKLEAQGNKTTKEIIEEEKHATHNLIDNNLYAERLFKLKVLDWLNNGQPKLFKSPAEGNYIVRLMNTSLTPEDNLGRMLHSFSTTAYECADYNYDNLVKYNIIEVDELKFLSILWETVLLSNSDDNIANQVNHVNGVISPDRQIQAIYFQDMIPGTKVSIRSSDTNGELIDIVIGNTGSYYYEASSNINDIIIEENEYYQGAVSFSYYGETRSDFDTIIEEEYRSVFSQYIGQRKNIISTIEDIKTEFIKFYNLDFSLRPIIDVKKLPEEYMLYYSDASLYNEYLLKENFDYEYEKYYYKELNAETGEYNFVNCTPLDYDEEEQYYIFNLETEDYDEIELLDEAPFDAYMKKVEIFKDIETHQILSDLDNLSLYRYKTTDINIAGNIYSPGYEFYVYKDLNNNLELVDRDTFEDLVTLMIDSGQVNLTSLLNKYLQQEYKVSSQLDYVYPITRDEDSITSASEVNITIEVGQLNDNLQMETISVPLTITREELIRYFLLNIYETNFILDEENIDLQDEEHYNLTLGPFIFTNISLGSGVVLNASYQTRNITYAMEDDDYQITDEFIDFLTYQEILNKYNAILEGNSDVCEINFSNIESILEGYLSRINLILNDPTQDVDGTKYDQALNEYSKYYALYQALVTGELTLLDIDIEEYDMLMNAKTFMDENLREARICYNEIYNNYVAELNLLIVDYLEESDYRIRV